MFLNNCLKVVGAAVTYFYGVFIEDFVVAVFLWEMLADQVQKFSSDVCLHVHRKRIFEPGQQAFPKETPLQQNLQ